MKVSAFMPMKNPKTRGDTYIEAIITHLYWADEVVVIDGGSTDRSIERIKNINDPRIRIVTRDWPDDWSWSEFAKSWNLGLDSCTGDWVAAGETDHIFHENEAARVREELQREEGKGKAVVKCQKLQSAAYPNWFSKSQMYYFINKAKFPKIRYGFDPHHRTDLAHPIWWEGSMYEGIPAGEAIVEGSKYEKLIGGTGSNLYNYLWTFKTEAQVVQERLKAARAWNKFSGFTDIHKVRWPEDEVKVKQWVRGQILSVRERSTRTIPIEYQPKIMWGRLLGFLKPEMIGSPQWQPEN